MRTSSQKTSNFHLKQAATPELFIYDEIGPDWMGMIGGETVARALEQVKSKEVIVRINSPGGDVFEGAAIYNALVRHPANVIVEIDGLAASAASLISMAGNTIRIAENAMAMIHNSWTIVAGNKHELLKTIEVLDLVDGNAKRTYAARTGNTVAAITAMMDAETWFSAQQAVAEGFADEISQPLLTISGSVRPGRYRNTPAALLNNGLDAIRARATAKKEELRLNERRPLSPDGAHRIAAVLRRNQEARDRLLENFNA